MSDVFFDPILGKLRTRDDSSGGSGGSSFTPVGGDGITIAGGTFTATVAAVDGGRITLSGGTATFNPLADIVNVTGASVTINPDTAYKIYATSSAVTINANVPASGKWGLEGHLEIFVASTGYIVTGSNVVLANALEPDAVNNCTVRFHDGLAIISVEDHVAGYIVVYASGSTSGTLPFGITSATQEYVAFDATLNSSTIDLSGATANGEKHIVGNGYSETTLTGSVDCGTSKFTVANLSLQNVSINGGVMTLGDAFIPSGSTVAVSGGGLAVEKVVGDDESSIINLGQKNILTSRGGTYYASACTFKNGSDSYGGAIKVTSSATVTLVDCYFTSNSAVQGALASVVASGYLVLSGCTATNNTGTYGDVYIYGTASAFVKGCSVPVITFQGTGNNSITLAGTNTITSIGRRGSEGGGTVMLESGAILDLPGNTNATPIAPGGGITFGSGGATVLYSSGAVSGSYMMDNVTLPAGAKLTNTNVIDLGGTTVTVDTDALVSGATITNGGASSFYGSGGSATLTMVDCTVVGNASPAIHPLGFSRKWKLSNCTVSGFNSLYVYYGASCTLIDCNVEDARVNTSGATILLSGSNTIGTIKPVYGSGSVTISSGAVVDLTGNTNTTPIAPGGGITLYGGTDSNPTKILFSSGTSSGSRTFERAEIYGSTITNLGLVLGATVTTTNDVEIEYSFDDGATTSNAQLTSGTFEVPEGAALTKVYLT